MSEVDDFLMHYGVKGMKWGERKRLHKEANTNFTSIIPEAQRRQMENRANSTITDERYSKLNDTDRIIQKGSVMKRVTSNPNMDSQVDRLFVSTNEADARNYRAIIPVSTTRGFVAKKHEGYYEATLQATTDLKSPSEKKRVDAYIQLMGSKEIALSSGEKVTGREYLTRSGLGDFVSKMDDKQVALTYYGQLVLNQSIHNDPMNTAYFNSLAKQGYNAMVDDNDRNVLSKEPLLTLDAKNTLRTLEMKPLSTQDVHAAQASLKLPDRE
jgi:uncharacterized protein YdbL (DUF1318 family)